MVKLAKKHAQHIVLCTLPINSRDFAPKGPFPADAQYIKASLALLKEDFPTAKAHAEEYIRQHPENALGYYLLGRIALAQGKEEPADTFFDKALNLDYGTNPRTIPEANSIVRRIAEQEGIMLADTAEDIRALRKKGIQDWQIFKEICHLRDTARPIIFNTIARTLSPSAPPLRPLPENTADEPTELQFAWFALGDIDSPDTFLSEQSFSQFRLIYLAPGLKTIEHYLSDRQALLNHAMEDTGMKTKPDWRILDANTGESLRRLGQTEAALKYLNKARDEGLKSAPLYISLALIMHEAGNGEEALQYINTALGYAGQSSRPTAEAVREIISNHKK
jgi:tetratricopeptide (TPR) repeat protein